MSRTILLQSFDDVPSIFRSSRIVGRHSDLSDLGMTFNCSNKIVLLLENLIISMFIEKCCLSVNYPYNIA